MYYCDVDATVESVQNCPTTHAFSLFVEIGAASEVVQTLKTWHDGNGYKTTVYVRSKYPEWGAGWQKLATATPPQVFDLPLAEGITAHSPCTYCKTQEKIVLMRINFLTTSQLTESNQIAVLPVGFRPEKLVEMLAYINNGTMCTLKILPSGVLSVGNGSIPVGTVCWTTVPLFIGT